MSILVTGGAGFIGSHLIERFVGTSGEPIVCLDNFNAYYDPQRKRANVAGWRHLTDVVIVEQDFCDADAMQRLFAKWRFRHVVHLGAYAGVSPSIVVPAIYQQVNVGGTLSLLEAARLYPVERFLLVSSSTVYGKGAAVPFREESPLGVPMSPYGVTKRAAELLGLCYHDLHGVPVTVLRPFSVYGPRLRPDLAMSVFTKAISEGLPLPLWGDGTIRRDFTHVADVCRGLIAALDEDDAVGSCFNLGNSDPIEIRQLIGLIEAAVGREAVIDWHPENPADMSITYADLTRSEQVLGYHPQVSIRAGVAEFVTWFLQRHAQAA